MHTSDMQLLKNERNAFKMMKKIVEKENYAYTTYKWKEEMKS